MSPLCSWSLGPLCGGGDLAPARAGLSPRRISDSHRVKCIFPPAFSQLTCRENNTLL